MYLDKIQSFLPACRNIGKDNFVTMIQSLAKRPGLGYKYEKDFLLTLMLVRF
jgi:hypothetical protein